MADKKFRVLVPEPLPTVRKEVLMKAADQFPPGTEIIRKDFVDLNEVPEQFLDVDVLFIYKLPVKAEHFERFPKVKVLVRTGVGVNNVDIDAADKHGVSVHNVPDYGSKTVASHAVLMALGMVRNLFGYHDSMRKPGAIDWDPADTSRSQAPVDLRVGILGRGRIGSEAAKLYLAHGCEVIFFDIDKNLKSIEGVTRVDTLDQLLRLSHILSLHVPDTKDTKGMIGAAQIELLPYEAVIVNTARGLVLDLDPVHKALQSGKLRGVCLDVMPKEPLTKENMHPLVIAYRAREAWLEGKVMVTPHSASHGRTPAENIHMFAAKTAAMALKGEFRNQIKPGGF
ncbi:Dehydrogenase [Tulasnella sp. JGI-2019a]|nr:Dehydrogenase [Tulasnella sp. JGI-2019a]KAG9037539.1 Dehydrogenase [Tulasnella sp. JGI-2019a]